MARYPRERRVPASIPRQDLPAPYTANASVLTVGQAASATRSIAVYRQIITRAWEALEAARGSRHPFSAYLTQIRLAQACIDGIERDLEMNVERAAAVAQRFCEIVSLVLATKGESLTAEIARALLDASKAEPPDGVVAQPRANLKNPYLVAKSEGSDHESSKEQAD